MTQVIFNNTPLRKKIKELEARVKALVSENDRLREKHTRCMAEQNDLMRAMLAISDPDTVCDGQCVI